MGDNGVRSDVRAFLDVLNSTPLARLGELGVEETRAVMTRMRAASPPVVHHLALVRDLECPGPAGSIRLRLYDPRAEPEPGPLAVYFHGGGFVLGDLESHHQLCIDIARDAELPVVAVEYRLAPEHPWPAAADDAEAAVRWIAKQAEDILGRRVTSLVLMGDSAGGNLAAVTANALRNLPAEMAVTALFLIYPTIGNDAKTASRREFAEGFFLSEGSIEWFEGHYAAALNDPRHDLTAFPAAGMPPTLLVTAGLDPLRDEGRDYAAALATAGVPVIFQEAVGNIHGCFGMRTAIPSSAADIDRALAALRLLVFP